MTARELVQWAAFLVNVGFVVFGVISCRSKTRLFFSGLIWASYGLLGTSYYSAVLFFEVRHSVWLSSIQLSQFMLLGWWLTYHLVRDLRRHDL